MASPALRSVLSAAIIGMTTWSAASHAQVSFVVEPVGQWNGSSCQSYALAIALAKAEGKTFSKMTARDLRAVETGIRTAIVSGAKDKSEITHDDLKRGIEAYTKDKYTIAQDREKGIVAMGDRVRAATGVSTEVSEPFFLDALVDKVVLTSVTEIGGQGKWRGHIVALLGVAGPNNSTQKMLVANSGVKDKPDERFTCVSHLPDEPSKYSAQVAWVPTASIQFKAFGNEHLAWTIVEKK